MADLKMDFDTDSDFYGDIYVADSDVYLTEGTESYRQRITINLRWFLGEYFLDTAGGIPWFENVFIKGASDVVVQQTIKNGVLEIPGILSLTKFDFDHDRATRELEVTLGVMSEEGEIDLSEIVQI